MNSLEMSKNIVIVGGGISGLALLHYLKLKTADRSDVNIRLLEKKDRAGGTATTYEDHDFLFESGPNGFLNNKNDALNLSKELGLESELIFANQAAKKRYILFHNRLEPLPSGFLSFLLFRPLSIMDKLRIVLEVFARKGNNPDESVYEFGTRRCGENFSKVFLDPMVTGIYAGDARKINLKEAFPSMFELERDYGSLIKAMLQLKKAGKLSGPGTLVSLRRGMSQLCEALSRRYAQHVQFNQAVESIERQGQGFLIKTFETSYPADELFVCTPAYVAAELTKRVNSRLSDFLMRVDYAPVAVVGLLYERKALAHLPEGFGYLIPTYSHKSILGVLFDSNIFPGRSASDKILFRVMMGGVFHRELAQKSEADLVTLAQEEITARFLPSSSPLKSRCVVWPRGIPQYDNDYVVVKESIERELSKENALHLLGNYLNGLSFNDCVGNARRAAGYECSH